MPDYGALPRVPRLPRLPRAVQTGFASFLAFGSVVASVRATFSADTTLAQFENAITWSAAAHDDGWDWTAPASDFVVPSGVSLVAVEMHLGATTSDFGFYVPILAKNGSNLFLRDVNQCAWMPAAIRALIPVVPGDLIQARVNMEDAGRVAAASLSSISLVGY